MEYNTEDYDNLESILVEDLLKLINQTDGSKFTDSRYNIDTNKLPSGDYLTKFSKKGELTDLGKTLCKLFEIDPNKDSSHKKLLYAIHEYTRNMTIYPNIRNLHDTVIERMLDIIYEQHGYLDIFLLLSKLPVSFSWSNTLEGYDYWNNIFYGKEYFPRYHESHLLLSISNVNENEITYLALDRDNKLTNLTILRDEE